MSNASRVYYYGDRHNCLVCKFFFWGKSECSLIPGFAFAYLYYVLFQVLYYLVRVEPFTTLAIQLQGGKFDHADRMFSDIGATWNGVLEDMSDVKELVYAYLLFQ